MNVTAALPGPRRRVHRALRRGRGFVLLIVIALLAVITTAVVVIAARSAVDVKRTARAYQQSQARLLRLAALHAAESTLRARPDVTGDIDVPLPPELVGPLRLTFARAADGVTVRAAGAAGQEKVEADFRFIRQGGGWVLADVGP
jgi:Tfp pilus assembly protein PilX